MSDDITEEEATAMLSAAQKVVGFTTACAKEISPDHIVPCVLSIIETAHGSLLAAAVLAQFGVEAPAEVENALRKARNHLRHFTKLFVDNGVQMIRSGEIPAEMVAAMPALKIEEQSP